MPDQPRVLVEVDGLKWAARLRIIGAHLVALADDLERLEIEYDEHNSTAEAP